MLVFTYSFPPVAYYIHSLLVIFLAVKCVWAICIVSVYSVIPGTISQIQVNLKCCNILCCNIITTKVTKLCNHLKLTIWHTLFVNLQPTKGIRLVDTHMTFSFGTGMCSD